MPIYIFSYFGMIVYHWTSKVNVNHILKDGLRQWGFVCKNKNDWQGEVCLVIDLPYEIDWNNRDEDATWQAIVHEVVSPSRIYL